MNWTEEQLNDYLKQGGKLKPDPKNRIALASSNMEPVAGNEPMAKEESQGLPTPCRLHFHSVRKRLADADGISGKACIDGIVHAGLLPDDSAEYVKEVSYSQEKGKEEYTVIEIYEVTS